MGYFAPFEALTALLEARSAEAGNGMSGVAVMFTSPGPAEDHRCVVVRGLDGPTVEERRVLGPQAEMDRRIRVGVACKVYNPNTADAKAVFAEVCAIADEVVRVVLENPDLGGTVHHGAEVVSADSPFEDAAVRPLAEPTSTQEVRYLPGLVARLDLVVACDAYDS